jgi:hypothetical protein
MHFVMHNTYSYRCYGKIQDINTKCNDADMLDLCLQREFGVLQKAFARPDLRGSCDSWQMVKAFTRLLTRLDLYTEACILAELGSLPGLV